MNRIRASLYVAILCSLPIAVPARAADQRAVKFGATLPATCWTGDIFFNPNAIAGSNLYACVALNTWVVQGGGSGGGAGNAGQLTDFTDTRVSAIEIDTALPAGGTRIRAGTAIRSVAMSPEKMVGSGSWCASGGQLWKYVDAATGAVKVDANANVTLANITFTAMTAGSNSASGFPADGSTPIASYTCGNNAANQWDTSPFADWRPFLGSDGFLAGPFTTVTPGARWTLGVDTSKVGNGANATMLVGAVSALSQSPGTPICGDGSGGVKDTGCSGSATVTEEYLVAHPGGIVGTSVNFGPASASGIAAAGTRTNLTGNSVYFARSSASGDKIYYQFPFPSNVTSIRVLLTARPDSTTASASTWTASLGCDHIGSPINSGSMNSGSASTVSSTTADQWVAFNMTAVSFNGCNADDQAYLLIARSGTFAGNWDFFDVFMFVTRTLP